ncbi:MAG: histidine phosphatase family protein, partial [Cytophagales bacterium]|nr:histidine phosphatase family protein [Cytophaga sp.]
IEYKKWGGESPVDVQNRQMPVMKEILESPYETILLCMHGRAIRILLSWLTASELKDMDEFQHGNLCLYILEGNENGLKIVLKNDHKHLKESY